MTSGLKQFRLKPERTIVAVAVVVLAAGWSLLNTRAAAESARQIPPPTIDSTPGSATEEVTVLAGGCFWGVQGVFQHVNGVTNAVSGYAGGAKGTAEYDTVGTGTTGHAESVQITFNPQTISYGKLLQIFFSVAHDPTQVNRQGPDSGTQYRSVIFPSNAEQSRVAQAYIAELDQAQVFKKKIATKIEERKAFYPAEKYHQDFLTNNPRSPYIMINDLPKIEDLKKLFPSVYRATPVLVFAPKSTK